MSRPALASFLVYSALAVMIGECWPLSRYPMYAEVPADGAIPALQVDGEWVIPEDLVGFHGCDEASLRTPPGVPHRAGWRQDEIGHWVTAHTAKVPGEVEVVFGYRILSGTAEGPVLREGFTETCRGTASWP